MLAYTKEKLFRLLKVDFIRFCIVGGTGFVINFALLVTLNNVVGLYVLFAQLIAAEIALMSNFMLHHHWTYKAHYVTKSIPVLLLQFHASSWPAIIGSALLVTLFEEMLHLGNFMSLAVSSVIILGWNFAWFKYVIWRDMSRKTISEIVD